MKLQPLDRATVEIVARIVGPHSAAAKALACADEHDGPVQLWAGRGSFVVQKLPRDAEAQG